jgi:hypothetical protein
MNKFIVLFIALLVISSYGVRLRAKQETDLTATGDVSTGEAQSSEAPSGEGDVGVEGSIEGDFNEEDPALSIGKFTI